MKKRSQKDLYDRIKKDLKEVHDADVDAIRKEMELERFSAQTDYWCKWNHSKPGTSKRIKENS